MGFHRSSHAVWDCRYHLIWSTKYRCRALKSETEREACERELRRIAAQYEMSIQTIEVDIDHVHIYIEIPPQRSVGSAVGVLKSLSAQYMFKRFPTLKRLLRRGHLWEASYCVRSVGDGVTAEMVKRYIGRRSPKVVQLLQLDCDRRRPGVDHIGNSGRKGACLVGRLAQDSGWLVVWIPA
jgi:putative transposase